MARKLHFNESGRLMRALALIDRCIDYRVNGLSEARDDESSLGFLVEVEHADKLRKLHVARNALLDCMRKPEKVDMKKFDKHIEESHNLRLTIKEEREKKAQTNKA